MIPFTHFCQEYDVGVKERRRGVKLTWCIYMKKYIENVNFKNLFE